MSSTIKERYKVSASMAFFLIHTMQIGIGILGYERYIAMDAEYDSWISIIITGLSIHLILWMMYTMLNKEKGDIIAIHARAYGERLGKFFSFLFAIYFLLMGVTVMRSYLEVVQVWMFPDMNLPFFLLVYIFLIYYTVSAGFRIVAGIAFFGVTLPIVLIFFLYFPLQYSDWDYLQPVFNHSIKDILLSSKVATLEYIGFEVILILYPFLKKAEKSQKWGHYGILFSTFIYVIVAVVSFSFYSQEQLGRTIWATLSMFKIVEFPFVERFEYIAITIWALITFPNICISLWCAGRTLKRTFSIRQRSSLIVMLLIVYILQLLISDRETTDMFITAISRLGFYLIYFYIPFLFIVFHLQSRRRHER
ncbi:GerAB/ArcD/ProY family transporter [Pseudalkalibacillus sp. R45]|uniref:GerAB/ArcD/ProY family transporter n=1 Tax=Pseudalkalibacillus sp. R45 TaxID=3457433 RepID=UPI003FCC6F05